MRSSSRRWFVVAALAAIGITPFIGPASAPVGANPSAVAAVTATTPDDSIVLVRSLNSLRTARGSGFIIGDGGWVVTASHVVSVDLGKGRRAFDPSVLVYIPWTGRPYEAKVVAVDGVADIALIRLPEAGFPALPLEGMDVTEATPALNALKDRPLRLYGFPLTYGEGTVAALAKPERNDARLNQVARRDETNLCVLTPCPDAQPGWSGGPMVASDRGTVVAVFHSLYRPSQTDKSVYPAGSLTGYLAELLRKAGATGIERFTQVNPPTVPRPAGASERMAREMRSLAWCADGRWSKAEEEQQDILKAAPEDPLARMELGRILLQAQKIEPAVKALEAAARLAPKSVFAQMYLGRVHHLNYDYAAAVTALKAASAAGPRDVEPLLVLAEVHEESQKFAEAETLLRSALTAFPTHPGIHCRLGNLLVKQAKPEEGFKLLTQATELSTADAALSYVPLSQGRALELARKFKEAEVAYRLALKADPDNATARYYLSAFFLRQNKLDDAQVHLNAGIRQPTIPDSLLEAFRNLQTQINEKGTGGK